LCDVQRETGYGSRGRIIVDVEKLQNGLYLRDVDGRCGYSNAEVTVEQCILNCVVPETVLGVAKLTV